MSAKKVVKFQSFVRDPVVGSPAFLYGVKGDYRINPTEDDIVQTSFVIDIGDDGRMIETKNTIYVMEE